MQGLGFRQDGLHTGPGFLVIGGIFDAINIDFDIQGGALSAAICEESGYSGIADRRGSADLGPRSWPVLATSRAFSPDFKGDLAGGFQDFLHFGGAGGFFSLGILGHGVNLGK